MFKRKKSISIFILLLIIIMVVSSCSTGQKKVKLDPKKPVIISVWHYYNGAIANEFNRIIEEFNDSVGAKEGIIVESYGQGNVIDLEKNVLASAKKEVGSQEMPNIFASYPDTAYEAEKMDILANLSEYLSDNELDEYITSYVEEGRIGLNSEFRIFPIAKATEIMMLNETDWLPFAEDNGLTYEDLSTMERLVETSKKYYEWSGGKAFFGRDSMANLFIKASKAYDTEIFQVENGIATINVNRDIMKKIWDNYYVPYISGYFMSYGKFRSDDAKVGDILCFIGSTSSASFFPTEVTIDGDVHNIEAKVLPTPHYENSKKIMIQQGAGMVITKSTPQEEYASTVFLKWFTDDDKNIEFAVLSGYMPVKKDAVDYDKIVSIINNKGLEIDKNALETLDVALSEIKDSELYTSKAFARGTDARAILEHNLQDKAVADRELVSELITNGTSLEDAVGEFDTEEKFNEWLQDLTNKLNEINK